MLPAGIAAPPRDCSLCPRLAAYRQANRGANPDWFNAPVPSFGAAGARLLVVGMAPGLRGANRTGRPFTGDHAGLLLYRTLLRVGLAEGSYGAEADDGLTLKDTRIANAVRCVPPANLPEPAEVATCNRFLIGVLV
jgi:uracil-DNA glycosylase family 4